MMAHQLLWGLLDEIRIAEWFAIIADETSDISHTEQLAISLHWVDTNYIINEGIIALCEVEQTDAATITSTIKDALIRCCLQISNVRAKPMMRLQELQHVYSKSRRVHYLCIVWHIH